MIAIIDYNLGNVGSIENMLKKLGHQAIITSDPDRLREADKLILPGVGSFDFGMSNLNKMGFVDLLNERVLNDKIPILGICLGMQLLTESSEEGILPGLGFIRAKTVKFPVEYHGTKLNIPHIGWNYVEGRENSPLFTNAYADQRFYFVHSYYVVCSDETSMIATSEYGIQFTCAISRENIFGVQFHPEKSHKFGMNLLKNFAELI